MSQEEILVGLNNAVARGESLEKAMQTIVTAGYNPLEVQEAARQVNMGVIGTLSPKENSKYKPLPTTKEKPKRKISGLLVILLIVILLILLGIGFFMFFGEEILKILFPTAA
jgi:hypothetical protein